MKRRDDWPERLFAFLESRRIAPFEWGTNDCVLLAMDAIKEMTDEDPIAQYRGQWTSAADALRLIQQFGGLEPAARTHFGEPIEPLMAWRGDLILFESGGRECLGINMGLSIAAPGEEQLIYTPISHAKLAWRV